ncbi:transposase [Promicromonospora sp. NPDC090134]|uniref:transposase n=1 Tax=Promicromonospora sp. NPDC090134 TaxID=3364408 RepID=UPI0037FA2F95
MGRPPAIPTEAKQRIVLAILSGELSIAQAAREEHVAEQSISRWKADFLKAGNAALLPGGATRSSSQEEHLRAQVQDLTQALGEAMLEAWRWKRNAQSRLNAPASM